METGIENGIRYFGSRSKLIDIDIDSLRKELAKNDEIMRKKEKKAREEKMRLRRLESKMIE